MYKVTLKVYKSGQEYSQDFPTFESGLKAAELLNNFAEQAGWFYLPVERGSSCKMDEVFYLYREGSITLQPR